MQTMETREFHPALGRLLCTLHSACWLLCPLFDCVCPYAGTPLGQLNRVLIGLWKDLSYTRSTIHGEQLDGCLLNISNCEKRALFAAWRHTADALKQQPKGTRLHLSTCSCLHLNTFPVAPIRADSTGHPPANHG